MPEQIVSSRSSPEIVTSIQNRLKEPNPKKHASSIFEDLLTLDKRAKSVRPGGLKDFPAMSQYLQEVSDIDWVKAEARSLKTDEQSKRLRELFGIHEKPKKPTLSKKQKIMLGIAALGSIFTPSHQKPQDISSPPPILSSISVDTAPTVPQLEVLKPEPIKEIAKNRQFGFRVTSPEDIAALPSSVGLIRIGGDSNLMYPNGHFHHNPDHLFDDMLKLADEKGLDVVFTYKNSNPNTPEEIIKNHLAALTRHPSIKFIEMGNEIDDAQFWTGSMGDYAGLSVKADQALKSLKKDYPNIKSELVISSFADPMGTQNGGKSNEYFMDLALSLKARGINTKDYLVAGHAYHLQTIEWLVKRLQEKTDSKGIIITEFGSDNPQEFEAMTELLQKTHIPSLVHEFNINNNPRTKNNFSLTHPIQDIQYS